MIFELTAFYIHAWTRFWAEIALGHDPFWQNDEPPR